VSTGRCHATDLSRSKSATGAGRTERPELTKSLGLITPGAHAEQSTGRDDTIAKSGPAVA